MAIIAKYTKNTIMIRNLFNNWCSKKLKGHEPMFRYFYICYWYSKKEYNDAGGDSYVDDMFDKMKDNKLI